MSHRKRVFWSLLGLLCVGVVSVLVKNQAKRSAAETVFPASSIDASAFMHRDKKAVQAVLGTPDRLSDDGSEETYRLAKLEINVRYQDGRAEELRVWGPSLLSRKEHLKNWLRLSGGAPLVFDGVSYQWIDWNSEGVWLVSDRAAQGIGREEAKKIKAAERAEARKAANEVAAEKVREAEEVKARQEEAKAHHVKMKAKRARVAEDFERSLLSQGIDALVRARGTTLWMKWAGCDRSTVYMTVNGNATHEGFHSELRASGFTRVECSDGFGSTAWLEL